MPAPITFVIPGVRTEGATRGARAAVSPVDPSIGQLKTSVTVTAERSAGDSNVRAEAVPGEDFVVLDIAGGPSLWLHPETAQELLQSQHDPLLARGGPTASPGEVVVPARLRWRLEEAAPAAGVTRGSFLGDVGLKAFHVITGIVEDKAADFAAEKIVEIVDSQVKEGVYKLQPDKLDPLKESPVAGGDADSLVLIHGTFSSTSGTFGKLWSEHPQLVAQLFKQF